MSVHLQGELDKLKNNILTLSSLVEQSVHKDVRSVDDRNTKMANEVVNGDHDIDLKEVEVEEECLKVLALYQPVAADLRLVIATLKINNDLERIGDLAVNIAHRAIYLNQQKALETPFDFEGMADKTRAMLRDALNSFVKLDTKLAQNVCEADDDVDAVHRDVYNKVYYGIRENPEMVETYIHYLSVSRHLERIADYATNIAEDVIYMIDGTIVRHSPKT